MSKKFLSGINVTGSATLNTVADAGSNTGKFLVLDSSNVVSYRTAAELYADLGIGSTAAYTSTLKHEVKASQAISKGQAVYVSSADGTNMIISKASNVSEGTSSKTMGLLETSLSTNGKGNVVTEGLLSGLNTSSAVDGDPVWLGVDGALIFGLANKPYAPAHLVFIGIVTRANVSNGEIFVKVQNGFEMRELHDYQEGSVQNNQVIVYESATSLYKPKTIPTILGYTPVPDSRTLTINGTTYDLTANRAWTITTDASARSILRFVATASQTTFTISGGYTPGLTDVYRNGVKLDNSTDFTATNGTTIVLTNGASVNDVIEVYRYQTAFLANNALRVVTEFVATAGQTVFNVAYNSGLVDVFYNGSKLVSSEFTAGNGTSITLAFPCNLNDSVAVHAYSYAVGAFTGQAQLNGTGLVRLSGTTITYDNATYATQSYVTTAVSNLVNSAPSTLDTLNELATALGNDANFATTITTSIATKLPLAGGTLTGGLTGTTANFSGDVFGSTGFYTRNSADTFLGSGNNTSGIIVNGNTLVTKIISGGNTVATFANAGGVTLTGALSGTSATFSSSVSIASTYLDLQNTTYVRFSNAGGGTRWGYIQQDGTNMAFANDISGGNFNFNKNVGIGTSSPNANGFSTALTINGTTTSGLELSVGGTNQGYIFSSSSALGLVARTNIPMLFYTNDTERMRITSGGNVGIGTSTFPAFTGSQQMTMKGGASTTNSIFQVQSYDAGTSISIYSGAGASDDPAIIFQKNLRFGSATDTSLGGYNERMRITSAGNVGIGTSSPSYKLDIQNGSDFDIRLRDNSLGGTVGILFETANDFSGTSQAFIKGIGAGNSGVSDLIFGTSGSAGSVTATERMRITSGGNVGIGVTPNSWGANWTPLQMGSYGAFISGRTDENSMFIGKNVFFNGTNWLGTTTGWAQQMFFDNSGNTIFRSVNATINTATGFNESMRITSGGDVCINNSSTYGAKLNVKGQGATGDTFAVSVADSNNATSFAVRNDKLILVPGVYGYAYASTANVFVQSDGYLGRNTSSLKYKHSIEDYKRGLVDVLKIRPVLYESKNPSEAGKKFTGFIAEEIDALGLTEFVQYGNDGKPDALQYPHFVALLVKGMQEMVAKYDNKLQEQQAQIEELKARLNND